MAGPLLDLDVDRHQADVAVGGGDLAHQVHAVAPAAEQVGIGLLVQEPTARKDQLGDDVGVACEAWVTACEASVTACEVSITAFEASVTAFEAWVTAFEASVTAVKVPATAEISPGTMLDQPSQAGLLSFHGSGSIVSWQVV